MLVITGASGLLGAAVLRSAVDLGRETLGLCHQHVIRDLAMPVATVDLTNESATRKLLSELRPDGIIHCAAAANVDWCEDHPQQTEAINVRASAVLAETAAHLHARFLYISTDSVFDGTKGNYAESDQPSPQNVYARSKLAGEQETVHYNPSATIARVSIYGWNAQNKQSIAEWILGRLEKASEVPGFTDVFFTPILVDQLAPILLDMIQQKLTGIYHVAGSERISKFEFARRVASAFGFDPAEVTPCLVKNMTLKATRPLDVALNTKKIATTLGRSMPSVDSGLEEFRALRDRQYPQQLKNYLLERSRP